MSVLHITSQEDFNEKILKADKPVLVDFFATWCGPCKMVAPELDAVAEDLAGKALIAKVDVDEQAQLASQYRVMGVPTLIVMKNGQELNRIVGYRPRKDLAAALEEHI